MGFAVPTFLTAFQNQTPRALRKPIVISTWAPNQKANLVAWEVLKNNGKALDAVHEGVQIPEADPEDQSVGYGGLPDRDGRVTVDACIMDYLGNCGAVMALEQILHPVSVAKMVMEKTPHVQLAGEGALQFALEMGFEKVNLLTEKSKQLWENWVKEAKYNPMTTIENLLERINNQHDTIGMLALGIDGNLAGACSTSGMAYKMRGRVGDSPIIGAGLYVDNEIGAATATGVGEELVRICGSHTIVEHMRQGYSPEESCKKTLERLVKMRGEEKTKGLQLGLIAVSKTGEYGCYALNKSFTMALHDSFGAKVIEAKSLF
jgi:N4-(beta-N-acetylglucosaminyl)-L-asparaginase